MEFSEIAHGTVGGYTNDRCRCNACRTAHTLYMQQWRQTRKELLSRGVVRVPHGNDSTYHNWSCRCEDCTDSHRINEGEAAARRRYRFKQRLQARAELRPPGPEEERPNWTPQYLDPTCAICKTKLVPVDALGAKWLDTSHETPIVYESGPTDQWAWDQWMCPHCLDEILFDWPRSLMERILQATKDSFEGSVTSEDLSQFGGQYVAIYEGKIVGHGATAREALADLDVLPGFLVYVGEHLELAPIDVVKAFYLLQDTCPRCKVPGLVERFVAQFAVQRSCKACGWKDLWRMGEPRELYPRDSET